MRNTGQDVEKQPDSRMIVKRKTNERKLNHFEGKIFRKKEHGPSTRNRTFKERQFSIPISCFKVRDFPWILFYALVIYYSCSRKKKINTLSNCRHYLPQC